WFQGASARKKPVSRPLRRCFVLSDLCAALPDILLVERILSVRDKAATEPIVRRAAVVGRDSDWQLSSAQDVRRAASRRPWSCNRATRRGEPRKRLSSCPYRSVRPGMIARVETALLKSHLQRRRALTCIRAQ